MSEMDEQIQTFCSFTGGTPDQAQRYLSLTDGNVEQAAELFFTSPDLGAAAAPPQPAPQSSRDNPIAIDDDDDDRDDDMQGAGAGATGVTSVEDDEAMARRLQEEMYGSGGGGPGAGGLDDEEIRAPMARTTETLVGPGSNWQDDQNEMGAAIAEQMMAREQRRQGRPGIFNQRNAPSIWTQGEAADPEARRQMLSRATGGASEQSAKSNLLADLFRPPHDLIAHLSWADARDEGKENEKWILVNVQDPSIFDCQVLNRDIWKNQSIRDTVKEHFIFLQYNKSDPNGQEYVQYYFSAMRENDDAYPHVAIIDPRTGEQVKTWSGSPAPKAADFLMDLHEFLDRYSLRMDQKNPVQTKRKEKKKEVAEMSEEEMMEMALQNSLANGGGPKEDDPDSLTKASGSIDGKGKAPVDAAVGKGDFEATRPAAMNGNAENDSPFAQISSTSPHEEPTSNGPETTRIQFRYSGGRIVRRFMLNDRVRRIFEWLKAAPLEGKETASFELICMGKNLIEFLDTTIADAGLKSATVMVEFIEDE